MKKPNLPNNQAYTEKLTAFGQRLQQLRLQRGLTLEQISVRTLIPVRMLSAIETGDRVQLPEPVYVQGFLRRYGDAVGIDGVELAEEFSPGAIAHSWRPTRHFNFQAHLRPLHLYLLYTVLVMGAISSLSYLLNRPSAQVTGLIAPPPKVVAPAAPTAPPIG
ncbi:MAG TPA: helix-turn-helix domain-containing protein, partial [Thermosynechococcaceae cyanobacterium]